MNYSQSDKDGFFSAVNSLKKYRRADLEDEETGKNLIDILYTDLLSNEQVLKTCLTGNTTFLIGRKGTGKSTIFLKLQQEYRRRGDILSCYIDTKTVFETSQIEYIRLEHLNGIISEDALKVYMLERNFIKSILTSLIEEINQRSDTLLGKIRQYLGISGVQVVRDKLKALNNIIENNEHLKSIEVPSLRQVSISRRSVFEKVNETSLTNDNKLSGKASPTDLGIDANSSSSEVAKDATKNLSELGQQFSDILLKVFQVKSFINQFKEILSLLKIKSLVVLLDDFSEIPDQSMKIFVDVILAPLNNWSEDFIKFKVAAYPNRIYYGKIDQGKIDKINLDFYNLYSTKTDRTVMEEKAIDFTKRIVDKRINYFTGQSTGYFFDTKKIAVDEYYELMFQISMNVPRIIGYILFYCYENKVVYGNPINRTSLIEAAEKYYEQAIEPFFQNTTYSLKSFEDKISILQLRELLNTFIAEMITTRKKIISNELSGVIYDEIRNNPHTSHFHLNPIHERFLQTLELNFFISKYSEMSGRDGGKQSVYCLNYGLCVRNNLRWGKPKGNEHRKYFISRPFDFNDIIESFLKNSKQIVCINPNCNQVFPFEQLQFLEFTGMKCPVCHNPVNVVSNSESLKAELEKIDKAKLLADVELGMLYELHRAAKPLKPREIAEELDCSYQLIGRRAKKLDETKGLVIRRDEGGQRTYNLTEKAESDYFSGTE